MVPTHCLDEGLVLLPAGGTLLAHVIEPLLPVVGSFTPCIGRTRTFRHQNGASASCRRRFSICLASVTDIWNLGGAVPSEAHCRSISRCEPSTKRCSTAASCSFLRSATTSFRSSASVCILTPTRCRSFSLGPSTY